MWPEWPSAVSAGNGAGVMVVRDRLNTTVMDRGAVGRDPGSGFRVPDGKAVTGS